jgi:hypothetical protein
VTHDDISTEELHLAYRVVDSIAALERGEEVSGHVLAAAAELLRIAYRARTTHWPDPGQLRLSE